MAILAQLNAAPALEFQKSAKRPFSLIAIVGPVSFLNFKCYFPSCTIRHSFSPSFPVGHLKPWGGGDSHIKMSLGMLVKFNI